MEKVVFDKVKIKDELDFEIDVNEVTCKNFCIKEDIDDENIEETNRNYIIQEDIDEKIKEETDLNYIIKEDIDEKIKEDTDLNYIIKVDIDNEKIKEEIDLNYITKEDVDVEKSAIMEEPYCSNVIKEEADAENITMKNENPEEIIVMENLGEPGASGTASAVPRNKFHCPLTISETLRIVLLPEDDSEYDYDDQESEQVETLTPIPRLHSSDEEMNALIQPLVNNSRVEVERLNDADDDIPLAIRCLPSSPSTASTSTTANTSRVPKVRDRPRWRKGDFEPPPNVSWKGNEIFDKSWENFTPLELFHNIFDKELIQHISFQTNIYALETKGKELGLNASELKVFIGILMKFGIISTPDYRYFWRTSSRYSAIADAMTRDRFEEIKSSLHFNNNANNLPKEHPEHDKLFRIRPIIESIRKNLKTIPQEEHQAVDEQMIPTKARISLKQYMLNKPHKWGYKMISRAGSSGFIYDFLIYIGKNTVNDPERVGLASAYVLKLTENIPENKNYKVFYDNWFSSLPLVDSLNDRGILCLSTVRVNHLGGVVLKEEKDLKREGRGSFDFSVEQNTGSIVIRWFDNKTVHLLSNYAGIEPLDKCMRWDGKKNTRVEVIRPFAIQEYNRYIGGVDLSDMLIELYRINFKSRKWYMQIFFYFLDMSVVNAWLLYRRVHKDVDRKKLKTLLSFKEDISAGLISNFTPAKRGRLSNFEEVVPAPKKRKRSGCPADSSRYDQTAHFPEQTEKPQRCKMCIKSYSRTKCVKCNLHLCLLSGRNCFIQFHTK